VTSGNADRLANKFIESAELQRENAARELVIVCIRRMVVYLTEVWSSESEWEEVRKSTAIAEWAKDLPSLVTEPPQSVRLNRVGGKVCCSTKSAAHQVICCAHDGNPNRCRTIRSRYVAVPPGSARPAFPQIRR
jgi:hypothetical protein